MPFSFPASPTNGQQSTQNGRVYSWNATVSAWELVAAGSITPSDIGAAAASHTHSASEVTDFAAAVAAASPEEVVEYLTTANFPATGNASLLYRATDSSRLFAWVGSQYAEVGPASISVSGGGGSYTLPNATTSTLGGVIVGTGLAVTSGTVSANVTSVAGRTGAVTIAAADVSGLATVATSGAYADLSGTPSTFTPVAWAVNRYVCPINATVGSGSAIAANTIYLMPFVAPRSFSFSELGARINTAAASSNFQLAIYGSSSSLLPTGTAIASTASLSGASATALSGSATGSLTGGVLYWMACNQDSASLVYQSLVAASLMQTFSTGASTLAIATNGNSSATSFRTLSSTFGTWPDLTSATTTETSGAQRTALIYMRVGALT
jgi:hypothetical protein